MLQISSMGLGLLLSEIPKRASSPFALVGSHYGRISHVLWLPQEIIKFRKMDLAMRVLGHPVNQLERPNDKRLNEERSSEEGLSKRNLKNSDVQFGRGNMELKNGTPSDRPK